MATNSAILSIRIVGDATDAVKEFQRTQDRAQAMQRGFERAAQLSVAALAGITAAALDVAGAASEAEQAAGAVESVFKAEADAIKGYAEDASQAVGLSAQSYNQLASVLGAQLTNMGLAGSELSGQTNDLIGLGADLAATFGGTTADAVAAVSSLLRGERDPIEQYGVSIKQADINARLASQGLDGLTGEAQRNAEMQATLAILTEQTASAQGQFQRESDTAAGAQQRMTAEWDNARAALGEALLPIMTDLSETLADVARWVGENTELVGIIVGVIGAFSAALVVARAAQIAMNIAMAANPIGLIITAVGLLIAGIVAIIANWDELKVHLEPIFTWFEEALANIGDWLKSIGDWIADVWNGARDFFGGAADFLGFNATVAYTGDTSALTAASTSIGATSLSATTSRIGSSSTPAMRAGDTFNITVNGAVDVDGTARTLEDVLEKHGRRTGRPVTTGGVRWR